MSNSAFAAVLLSIICAPAVGSILFNVLRDRAQAARRRQEAAALDAAEAAKQRAAEQRAAEKRAAAKEAAAKRAAEAAAEAAIKAAKAKQRADAADARQAKAAAALEAKRQAAAEQRAAAAELRAAAKEARAALDALTAAKSAAAPAAPAAPSAPAAPAGGTLTGYAVAFTGTGPRPRKALMQSVRDLGGMAYDEICTACNLLVVCDKPGRQQLEKAARWGVKTIYHEDFYLNYMLSPARALVSANAESETT